MLKDPRWDNKPSLAGFALFVASKDPAETYIWHLCEVCPVGQYLKSIGRYVGAPYKDEDMVIANALAYGTAANLKTDWVFGKLANRILKYQMTKEKSRGKVA